MPDTLAIAFATSEDIPNLTDDDRLLVNALRDLGVKAGPVVWSNAAMDWKRFSAVLIRSCWDYHHRPDEFLGWLAKLEADGVRTFNPPSLVRWNSEKTYLRDLSGHGVAVVPTRFVEQNEKVRLADLLKKEGWKEAVVKPAISASAHATWRVSEASAPAEDAKFEGQVANGRVLVQPFVSAIESAGEWSLLFYGGSYSHAVLKRPKSGDFRVQKEHGGTSEVVLPPGHVIDAARRVIHEAAKGRPDSLYARVDGCVIDNHFTLMELELIEPDLFLRSNNDAPRRLAAALLEALR